MKHIVIIASLLAAAFVGLAPAATAADCSTFDPGAPGGGVEGQTVWYAKADAFSTCTLGNALQAAATTNGGAIATKLTGVAVGATTLLNAGGLNAAATAFAGATATAGIAQAHDACTAAIGSNPQCGSGATPSQAQSCAAGAGIPNPVGGGLAGNTLANSNSALQGTCALGNAAAAIAPGQTQLTAYETATQATLLSLNGDVFALASSANDGACLFLVAATPCT